MLRLNGRSILLGGFHDHWSRAGGHNSALLLAALDYYHYDFMTLMDGDDEVHQRLARQLSRRIRIYPGREDFFGWGHVVTVNPREPRIRVDDEDCEATMRRLKQSCDLVILAHPEYHVTWEALMLTGEVDRLMDKKAFDGINLINCSGFADPFLSKSIEWYNKREAQGLFTPIVNGWDAHLVLPAKNLPPVLYTRDRTPRKHIDTAGNSRTILFCEDNELPAIVDAVKRGQTVIEDLMTGELVGPKPLVAFLKDSNYAGAIARLDGARDQMQLTVSGPWMAQEKASFALNCSGAVTVAVPTPEGLKEAKVAPQVKKESAKTNEATREFEVEWSSLPDLINRDYAAVALHCDDGEERIWAVETRHPIQLELLPLYREGIPGVELRALRPFQGEVAIEIPGLLKWLGKMVEPSLWLPLPQAAKSDFIQHAKWEARLANGLARKEETQLTFIAAQAFDGNWDRVPVFAIDNKRFAPEYSYGLGRPYPGPDVYAIYAQFAWDEKAIYMKAHVRDAVHYQPKSGHYVYDADCLQLAFDPILRRDSSTGRFYSFNLALTPDGPELFRWLSPTEEAIPGYVAPTEDVSLGDKYLKIERWAGGLIYEMTLPWSELAPAVGKQGHRMGVYLIGMNNNGDGLLDTLHWPVHFPGMWVVPNRWGIINFV